MLTWRIFQLLVTITIVASGCTASKPMRHKNRIQAGIQTVTVPLGCAIAYNSQDALTPYRRTRLLARAEGKLRQNIYLKIYRLIGERCRHPFAESNTALFRGAQRGFARYISDQLMTQARTRSLDLPDHPKAMARCISAKTNGAPRPINLGAAIVAPAYMSKGKRYGLLCVEPKTSPRGSPNELKSGTNNEPRSGVGDETSS